MEMMRRCSTKRIWKRAPAQRGNAGNSQISVPVFAFAGVGQAGFTVMEVRCFIVTCWIAWNNSSYEMCLSVVVVPVLHRVSSMAWRNALNDDF